MSRTVISHTGVEQEISSSMFVHEKEKREYRRLSLSILKLSDIDDLCKGNTQEQCPPFLLRQALLLTSESETSFMDHTEKQGRTLLTTQP